MKKSAILIFAVLLTGNLLLSSCTARMFSVHSYRQGQHATPHGTKAQAKVSKATKRFWF
jgi:hypothetical protein